MCRSIGEGNKHLCLLEGNLFTDHLRLFWTLELHSIPTPIGNQLQNPRSSKGIGVKLFLYSIYSHYSPRTYSLSKLSDPLWENMIRPSLKISNTLLEPGNLVLYLFMTGWWYTYPSEKYESQWEILSHILWKIKHVWNHLPVIKG